MAKKVNCSWIVMAAAIAILVSPRVLARVSSEESPIGFPPLEEWRSAVIHRDSSGLRSLYRANPPAGVRANGVETTADEDIKFWLGLEAKSVKLQIVRLKERTYGESVIFKATVQTAGGCFDGCFVHVTDAQAWKKDGDQWHIFDVERTDSPHLAQPSDMNKDLYPDNADARAEIKEAEERAHTQHRRVLLIFGANWCYDCHVLDLALRRPDLRSAVSGYEIVHVDIGPDGKKNADVAQRFDVPLDKGVPALAVIESDGKLVVSQKNGEFEDARALTPEVLLEFLNKWKPAAR